MEDKKIYMELDNNSNQELKKELKNQLKEQPAEFLLNKLSDDIDIKMLDNIVNISMPEPTFQIIATAFKQLNINLLDLDLDKGISR